MAHPMRQQSLDDHEAKIKAMTDDYGGSPQKEKPFLRDEIKHGPEQQVAKRAEGGSVRARMDRRAAGGAVAKRASGGGVILRKRGGHVKRADGGDVSSIEEANRDQAMSKKTGGAVQRASGGRTKSKKGGHTHVNVIVAPQGGGAGAGAPPMGVHPVPPVVPPMMPPGAGGMPPPGMPPRPPMGAGPMMAPPPGMPPPGMIPPHAAGGRIGQRARGGKVEFKKGEPTTRGVEEVEGKGPVKVPARASGGEVEESLKEQGLHRSDKAERARGGHVMTAGGHSGVGRLEKIGRAPHDAGKPQVV